MLDFSQNLIPVEEVDSQLNRNMRTAIMGCDREYPPCRDVITDESDIVDPQLPVLAKVSSLLEVLRLGENYELVEHLWTQFFLTASCINIEVCLSRNGVLVRIRICSR